jgi:hypothetical protein
VEQAVFFFTPEDDNRFDFAVRANCLNFFKAEHVKEYRKKHSEGRTLFRWHLIGYLFFVVVFFCLLMGKQWENDPPASNSTGTGISTDANHSTTADDCDIYLRWCLWAFIWCTIVDEWEQLHDQYKGMRLEYISENYLDLSVIITFTVGEFCRQCELGPIIPSAVKLVRGLAETVPIGDALGGISVGSVPSATFFSTCYIFLSSTCFFLSSMRLIGMLSMHFESFGVIALMTQRMIFEDVLTFVSYLLVFMIAWIPCESVRSVWSV